MTRVIFDLGANKGQNLSYYLSKADRVVAVEANPVLSRKISADFAKEVADNRLHIVNKCIADGPGGGNVTFYVHRYDSGLSRLIAPSRNAGDYDPIEIGTVSYQELIDQFGQPYFTKIDLEGYDKVLLSSLIRDNALPNYISFENCGREILHSLIETGQFNSFNIVSFYNFSSVYRSAIKSAGPFGDDIKSPWLNAARIGEVYDRMPSAWFDIHLSKSAFPIGEIEFSYYKMPFNLALRLKRMVPHQIRRMIKNVLGMRDGK